MAPQKDAFCDPSPFSGFSFGGEKCKICTEREGQPLPVQIGPLYECFCSSAEEKQKCHPQTPQTSGTPKSRSGIFAQSWDNASHTKPPHLPPLTPLPEHVPAWPFP